MDRALNPEFLADALGQHAAGTLPTVEQLAELIADVEVRAFIRPTGVDDELLRTAWYLHGVASAAEAENLYPLARQQRAFAVSAHIFDLALNDLDRPAHDRLTLAFGAQVGYRRADLDPNATAVWRRVDGLLDSPQPGSDDEAEGAIQVVFSHAADGASEFDARPGSVSPGNFITMALRAGVAFLGLDVGRVGQLLGAWRAEALDMATLIGAETLRSTMFGPAEAVVSAVADLMAFLRYGERTRLEEARARLNSVIDLEAGQGDHDARWVAAHLRTIADGMETSSVWSVLPSGTPSVVAQAFTVGSPPVLTLWPPQRELLQRTTANPLDPATKRLLLSVPTSAGKTLVAQILICHHLATQSGNVCYVTPLRSLGREMRQALAGRLRVLQKGVGGDFPDFGDITIEDLFSLLEEPSDSSVEVMTPERLSHLLRQDPEGVLEQFSMFVVDEAHLLAQPGRGFLLESLLAMLSLSDARLILLSGVMGNAQQVATWLDPTSTDVLFSSSWRGPRRLHALLYSNIVWQSGDQLPAKSKAFDHIARYPMIADLRVRAAESNPQRLATSVDKPIGEVLRNIRKDGTWSPKSKTPFYRLCARTAHALLPAGSLLMILSRRDYARNAAQEVSQLLSIAPRTSALCDFLEERLGGEHPLVDCVRHGVAYHHAGLPIDVLDALEQAMRSEVLIAMFATSTLTDGVNLPVRTVVISETRYEGQDPGQQLDAPRLLNAVGRAGRAGKESEGWIVLGLNQAPDDQHFDLLQPAAEELVISSTLCSEVALTRLAEAEELIATTADAIFKLGKGETADFASFVWFVLTAAERLDSLATHPDLRKAVRGLLAFAQLPTDLEERWIAFANHVGQVYVRTPAISRLRWMTAGTALGSAVAIEQIAIAVADEITSRHGDLGASGIPGPVTSVLSTDEALEALEAADAFLLLLNLPEAGKVWSFKSSVAARASIDVPVIGALRGWLRGMDMPGLAAAILPTVSDTSWRLEQTVDAVSGAFEHFLSWTVGVVTSQVNEMLVERGGLAALPKELAYLIRYGVDTRIAQNLLISGVSSRRVAHLIGQQAEDREIAWGQVRNWLRDLHIDGWQREFGASPREVEDLAEFCRSPSKSPLRQLIEDHETSVSLQQPMSPLPPSHLTVELRIADRSQPAEIWTMGRYPISVGIVATASHLDVCLLHTSGIEYTATSDGISLSLRESR
ncbi:DEAD/DEAH box helicase [Kribbella sp. NPDC058245]|uniref:DEAD/DEAH box helicase n=1 Tax=Kribbella sp. NPDC058245 TaxID=3346399 RepID=UPI0036F06834